MFMQTIYGSQAAVSFAGQNYVGSTPYTGPLDFAIIDDQNVVFPVDPTVGVTTAVVQAQIDAFDPQKLNLSKVTEGIPFTVRASYSGVAAACSVPSVQHQLVWAAPQVFVAPICVTTTA